MELDKAKLQEVVEKIAYQQTAEDQADDLFNKMGILNKYVQEQLTLTDVSQQRELLEAYTQFLWTQHNNLSNAENNEIALNKFIASNCG
jgi:hypothetical protein